MTKPTDIVIACCKDEEDIISEFIEFNLDMGFDQICLIDNGSSDNTVSIIESYSRKFPVIYSIDPHPGHDKRLLQYFREFKKYANRWVFFLDIDEFIYFPSGAKIYLNEIRPEFNIIQFQIKDMFHDVIDHTYYEFPLMSIYQEKSFHDTVKEICLSSCEINKMFAGKHYIDAKNRCVYSPTDIFIQHYYFRSPSQVKKKLHNRILADAAFSEDDKLTFSAYPLHVCSSWIEETEKMLRDQYWNSFYLECSSEFEINNNIQKWFAEMKKNA